MLTLFAVPKPFRGFIGDIQRTAIESWQALRPAVQIVLVGDDEGVEQAARDAGVAHVKGLVRNERGTPRLDSAFERVEAVARWPLWCMVNADIVLLDDFLPTVERVAASFRRFLVVGECRDVRVPTGLRFEDPAAREQLRETAIAKGRLRGYAALDYFVFPRGEFGDLPPFLIGRACFDNWLVWRVRQLGHPVVDATRSVIAIHQPHDYGHVPGGKDESYYGKEAHENERLAGGRSHIYTLHDASHRIYRRGRPVPYWGSILRLRERARATRVRIEIRRNAAWAGARRRANARDGRSPVVLLGVFPEPAARWTAVLDAVAGSSDVDLTVLYGGQALEPALPPPRHPHWYPRAARLAAVEKALGHEYPINWAIWNSFRGLRPDCMLIAGWDTFASQAAIAWCLARRVPYLLLADRVALAKSNGHLSPLRRSILSAIVRRASRVLADDSSLRSSPVLRSSHADGVQQLASTVEGMGSQLVELAREALIDRSPSTRSRLAGRYFRS